MCLRIIKKIVRFVILSTAKDLKTQVMIYRGLMVENAILCIYYDKLE